MRRVLIIGSNGALGQDLVDAFSAEGDEIEGTTRDTLDVTDTAAVRNAVLGGGYDVVVNATAYNNVDEAETPEEEALESPEFEASTAAMPFQNRILCSEVSSALSHYYRSATVTASCAAKWQQCASNGRCQALMALLLLGACTVNPATGEREFTLVTPSQEAAIGAEENPKFVAEYGGALDNSQLQSYVAAVGGRLAASSEMPGTDFQFTVLNSSIINAFALPGGYVNISRGLMAFFNDEAELAGVLGHEIGHVTARHFANRYTQASLYGLGAGVIGAVSGSDSLSGIASTGANLVLLKNSRSQETQADALGVRYMGRVGYDLMGSVRMLERLVAATGRSGQETSFLENWMSTHPADAKRVARARENVAAGNQASNPIVNSNAYLNAIDGMLFGDDPRQGVIRGQDFLHPVLLLAFTAPSQFTMQNTARYVIGAAENAQFAFSGSQISSSTTTRAYLDQVWNGLFENGAPQPLSNIRNVTAGGMAGVSGQATLAQEGGNLDVTVVAFHYDTTNAYHFILISTPEATAGFQSAFNSLVQSFRKLSSSEAAAIKPLRVKVIIVGSGDTISSLAHRMAVESGQEELFRVLNGLGSGDTIQKGQRLKLIVEGN